MSTNTAATESAGYIMGRTNEEYTRLKRQAQVWEPMTKSVLERAGITPGMRCLDAGCGPGEVMRLMAGYVGSTGSVVGLDADAAIGAEAVSVFARRGLRAMQLPSGRSDRDRTCGRSSVRPGVRASPDVSHTESGRRSASSLTHCVVFIAGSSRADASSSRITIRLRSTPSPLMR